jgi:hypothetical protein
MASKPEVSNFLDVLGEPSGLEARSVEFSSVFLMFLGEPSGLEARSVEFS